MGVNWDNIFCHAEREGGGDGIFTSHEEQEYFICNFLHVLRMHQTYLRTRNKKFVPYLFYNSLLCNTNFVRRIEVRWQGTDGYLYCGGQTLKSIGGGTSPKGGDFLWRGGGRGPGKPN